MKLNWFVRKGIFYWPVSIVGWLILIAGLAYAVYTFVDIDSRSHSASDTLINFGFNLLILGLIYTVIAYFTERKPKAVSN
ncbi:MAG: hypothetical protein JWR76_1231 [Mucilaginibacter sp.]|jgi:hypothetical protein|nr:hypothetical protein [Mucilaginibacter sp.]